MNAARGSRYASSVAHFPARLEHTVGERLHSDGQQPCARARIQLRGPRRRPARHRRRTGRSGPWRRASPHRERRIPPAGPPRWFCRRLRNDRFSSTWVDMIDRNYGIRRAICSRVRWNSVSPMRYIAAMELLVNGELKTCAESTSLAQLIEQLGMKGDRVAVELNREIVPRAQWDRDPIARWRPAGNRSFCRRRQRFSAEFVREIFS